jgi:hypothetical protein
MHASTFALKENLDASIFPVFAICKLNQGLSLLSPVFHVTTQTKTLQLRSTKAAATLITWLLSYGFNKERET